MIHHCIIWLDKKFYIANCCLVFMFDELEIKARIIRKLVQWKKWGGAHTENILKGLPSHLRGEKITKNAVKELISEQWLIPAKKTGEIHYSLNPRKVGEILQFYEKYCKRDAQNEI